MSYTVRYKIYPNDDDPILPECYVKAYHACGTSLISGGVKEVEKNWKELTGSTLRLTHDQTIFKVTFASEADAAWFMLRWS